MTAADESTSSVSAYFLSTEGQQYDDLEGIIDDALDTVTLVPWHDDQTHGDIMEQVKAKLTESALVFADLSHITPTVAYEIGYAHAQGIPVVLFREKGSGDPGFALSQHRWISYEWKNGKISNIPALKKNVRDAFRMATETARVRQAGPLRLFPYPAARVDVGDLADGKWVVDPRRGPGRVNLVEERDNNSRRYLIRFRTSSLYVDTASGLPSDEVELFPMPEATPEMLGWT